MAKKKPVVGSSGFLTGDVVQALTDVVRATPSVSLNKSYLVTGGNGFIGSGVVRALLESGAKVGSFDNNWRGNSESFADWGEHVEMVTGDIRDPSAVANAVKGVDCVCHLACVNGTEYFYSHPDLVLDVGVKGVTNVIDACMKHEVGELSFMSSSEVYQTPAIVPTDESAALSLPDPLNPRYSYAGAKVIGELMVINYGRKYFDKVTIVRPHNIYGPNMGWEHVVPQFITRMKELVEKHPSGPLPFPIQGSGQETRSFAYISDMVEGYLKVLSRGENLGIYHVGTQNEISIIELAKQIAACFEREVEIVPGALQPGGTPRRCPDISKVRALGYEPKVSLAAGLQDTVAWYLAHYEERPRAKHTSKNGPEANESAKTPSVRNEQQSPR